MKIRESDVEKRKLGTRELEVSTIGLEYLGMSEFYGRANEGEATAPIHRVLDLGENFRSGRMKAFGLAEEGSPAGVLDVPTPGVGSGEVRVKFRASSVNGWDSFVASGMA